VELFLLRIAWPSRLRSVFLFSKIYTLPYGLGCSRVGKISRVIRMAVLQGGEVPFWLGSACLGADCVKGDVHAGLCGKAGAKFPGLTRLVYMARKRQYSGLNRFFLR